MPHIPIAKICTNNLLKLGRAFAKSRKPPYKLTTVSTMIHGDPQLLPRLADGKGSITVRKYDAVMAYFDRKWPEGVPRPEIQPLMPIKADGGG